jgi:mannose/fructose/N-acetylgalactosamine-specific phosphotransferase system component IIC
MAPTYRERLRVEGGVLAGAGALASLLLVATTSEATEHATSTAIQLAAVALLLVVLGPLGARRWMARARPLAPGEEPSGLPTALYKPPLIMLVLAALVVAAGELAGQGAWDAVLRVTLGCLLVGLAQAVLLERVVAADEARSGRRYVRVPGSRALGGTKLGFF